MPPSLTQIIVVDAHEVLEERVDLLCRVGAQVIRLEGRGGGTDSEGSEQAGIRGIHRLQNPLPKFREVEYETSQNYVRGSCQCVCLF